MKELKNWLSGKEKPTEDTWTVKEEHARPGAARRGRRGEQVLQYRESTLVRLRARAEIADAKNMLKKKRATSSNTIEKSKEGMTR